MSVTTRKGYRKSLIAKRFQKQILMETGKTKTLRETRKIAEAYEACIKTLKPLKQAERIKVVRAVKILHDLK